MCVCMHLIVPISIRFHISTSNTIHVNKGYWDVYCKSFEDGYVAKTDLALRVFIRNWFVRN